MFILLCALPIITYTKWKMRKGKTDSRKIPLLPSLSTTIVSVQRRIFEALPGTHYHPIQRELHQQRFSHGHVASASMMALLSRNRTRIQQKMVPARTRWFVHNRLDSGMGYLSRSDEIILVSFSALTWLWPPWFSRYNPTSLTIAVEPCNSIRALNIISCILHFP